MGAGEKGKDALLQMASGRLWQSLGNWDIGDVCRLKRGLYPGIWPPKNRNIGQDEIQLDIMFLY